MGEALKLARRPTRPPYPNPWVGCVLVKGNRVVGRGWHKGPGTMHAEADALAKAGERARGATVFVTLEPCCHQGRTPPCTDALIRAGVGRVIYASRDPNPLVAGKGEQALRRHGIEVTLGVCAAEARKVNEVYLKYRASGLPFVSIKVAASLDGKIATRTGRSKWITDPSARRRGRRIRSGHQAVLVGIGTVIKDDPHLGPRNREGRATPGVSFSTQDSARPRGAEWCGPDGASLPAPPPRGGIVRRSWNLLASECSAFPGNGYP